MGGIVSDNIPKEILLAEVAAGMKDSMAFMPYWAEGVFSYYTELMKAGFDAKDALYLVGKHGFVPPVHGEK
jgi:hypothetical protein